MSFGRRNSHPAGERKRGPDLELSHIVIFLRYIAVMTGALLVLAVLFFLLSEKTAAGNVAYILTILVNAVGCGGSLLAAGYLDRKDKELTKKEQENGGTHHAL